MDDCLNQLTRWMENLRIGCSNELIVDKSRCSLSQRDPQSATANADVSSDGQFVKKGCATTTCGESVGPNVVTDFGTGRMVMDCKRIQPRIPRTALSVVQNVLSYAGTMEVSSIRAHML